MKKIKILMIIILCFVFVITGSNLTLAYKNDSTLYYNGKSKTFTYYNINDTDLFSDFKELMPGDKKNQTIRIKLDNVTSKTIMYLKVLTDINNDDLLNKINIKIYKNNDIIFDSYKTSNENIIKIHEFSSNDNIDLKIELLIPEELGNEISDLTKNLELEFMVEVNDELINVPKTYDDSNIVVNIILMITSLIMIIVLILYKKDKKVSRH